MTNRKLSIFVAGGVLLSPATLCAVAQEGPAIGYSKIPKDAYSVVAEVHAKPGKAEELRAATLPLIALVRSDPKNLAYFFQQDREDPSHFVFYEIYANKEDFEAHNNKAYVKAWFAKLPTLADGPVKTTRIKIQTSQ